MNQGVVFCQGISTFRVYYTYRIVVANTKKETKMSLPHNSTNLRNRVKKLYLPKTKALYPLFEVVSNSIHAIQEKKDLNVNFKGKIRIIAIRNGNVETLKKISNIEEYPINSFQIIDNGIGLNKENIKSFAEFDSEKKAEIGGKGVGRLICLKAFQKITVESIYQINEEFKLLKFGLYVVYNG